MTTPPPFFVIGFQRSGTTLLRVMLDSHPDVAVPLDTTGLWFRYEDQAARYGDLAQPAARRALIADLLREERIALWGVDLHPDDVLRECPRPDYPGVVEAFYRAYARRKGKARWGDKDPGNIVRIPALNRWFPGCRIVHVIRDGRGACLSHLSQAFGFDDLLACAESWREQVWWARRMGELLGPARYLEVRYEGLVAEPARELERVADFLGLPYSDAMLRYPDRIAEAVPAEKRHIWPRIGEPPDKENATRWKGRMSRAVQVCFEKRAGELLAELGYETTPRPWRGEYATELRFLAAGAIRAARARLRRSRRT